MHRGLVISDLHLFSRRSRAEVLLEDIQDEISAADILVLNGDVFDFRWSTLRDMKTTIAAALHWLERLIERHPDLAIHYLLGNHDCVAGFTQRLLELSETHRSLVCHETHVVLGRNLFLHGDCANRRMDRDDLRRFRESWSRDRQRGRIGRVLYDGADALGASRKVHDWWFPRHGTVLRLAHHLEHVMPDWRGRIDHCYFGHTHLPFRNHRHEGVMFHNTGSAIRDMGFLPLPFTCDSPTARSQS